MSVMTKAISRSNSVIMQAAVRSKSVGLLGGESSAIASFGSLRDNAANKERYGLFHGWVYAAINAIASEGAGQPVSVGKLLSDEEEVDKRNVPLMKSARKKMQTNAMQKTANEEFEILLAHPLMQALEKPNPIQGRWQFVYTFISNLCLTGWGYIIGGKNEQGKFEFYALPTTWVRPNHEEGPFSRFKIVDPRNPVGEGSNDEWLTRENVAFAHLPNPADPRSALAPAQTQIAAIRIDDHIQTSQDRFFENGIFPSGIITVGKDPHPEVPAGVRPRLTGAQRRQVYGAIRKVIGGVANYGNPAIVDGLIEKIERFSMSSNEMGWDKSEDKIITRILSSFGVHRYILGDTVASGGYAQVAKIEERFCKRVNTFLDMLGTVMGNFVGAMDSKDADLFVWWDKCAPHDPALRWMNLRAARNNGDISRNELRAELGFPPDKSGGDRITKLRVGDINSILTMQTNIAQGFLQPEQAIALCTIAFDLTPEESASIIGGEMPLSPEAALEAASGALSEAVGSLGLATVGADLPSVIADKVLDFVEK